MVPEEDGDTLLSPALVTTMFNYHLRTQVVNDDYYINQMIHYTSKAMALIVPSRASWSHLIPP